MSGLTPAGGNGIFLNIAKGRIRRTVDKETEGAIARSWETQDGKSGTKHELVYKKIEGIITDIQIRDSDYGEQLNVTVNAKGESYILTMPSESRYALDLMRKLPVVDLESEVELAPYDFEDNGKTLRGVTVTQHGNKIKSYFFDYEQKKPLHGMPVMTEKNPDSDDWKMHFIKVRKFLKKYLDENIIPKLKTLTFDEPEPEESEPRQGELGEGEDGDLPF